VGANLDLLLEQILDRGSIEYALGRFGGRQPGVADRARGGPVLAVRVGARSVHELVRDNGTFEGGDDFAEGQLPRVARQLVPAVGPTDTADDADAAEAAQELVKVGFGDFLAGGDLGTLHRALPGAAGELDNRVRAIIATHSEPHLLQSLDN
jgi:hypothetical protein